MELFAASNQWSSRPIDERFSSLEELYTTTKEHQNMAIETTIQNSDLRVKAVPGSYPLQVNGTLPMTNWAFGQLCRKVKSPDGTTAPPDYLRSIPPAIAESALNYGIKNYVNPDNKSVMLVHDPGQDRTKIIRAFLTTDYKRVWNASLVDKLFALRTDGWKTPPARPAKTGGLRSLDAATPEQLEALKIRQATAADVMEAGSFGLSVNIGDWIQPAGLYASFEDMFVFMVNEKNRINDGTEQGLGKGFFLINSEVGKQAVTLVTFLYRFVCGNHIVWGASAVTKARFKHVGNVEEKWQDTVSVELEAYANESVSDLEARILGARNFRIAGKPEEVIEKIFKSGFLSRRAAMQVMYGDAFSPDASKNKVENGYILPEVDGDPTTAWAFAQGLTRLSQGLPNIDDRTRLDSAAGKIIDMSKD